MPRLRGSESEFKNKEVEMGQVIMLSNWRSAGEQFEVNRRLMQREGERNKREIDRLIGKAVDECRNDMATKLFYDDDPLYRKD